MGAAAGRTSKEVKDGDLIHDSKCRETDENYYIDNY
jgi:hypothetical protein